MSSAGRRIRVDLAYDGTRFAGWQVQPRLRTVQGVVEAALGRLHGGAEVRLRGAGRTDAGVHARGQVADAWVTTDLDDRGIARALAGLLPEDVRPLGARTVGASFDARRDAARKSYAYWIDRTPRGDPFLRRFAHRERRDLNAGAIQDALALLPGSRDWSAFAGSASEVANKVRNMLEARLEDAAPGLWVLVFTADGFLNHMARNLVGTLIEVGLGRIPPRRIEEILASRDRRLSGPTAPARGLCLERVSYPPSLGADALAPPSEEALRRWCRMARSVRGSREEGGSVR